MHLVASNVGTAVQLPANQPIELAFDRLLLPITVNRQSFPLVDSANNSITCTIGYDPVARVVTLTPLPPGLVAGNTYKLTMESPSDPTDPSGLHAIDGATMDPGAARTITVQVAPAGPAPATCGGIVGPCMSFCTDIMPIFGYAPTGPTTCSGSNTCHAGTAYPTVALGLALTGHNVPIAGQPALVMNGMTYPAVPATPSAAQSIQATAINRLSVESTMGALSQPGPPSFHFGQDMPIIGTGDPGNSFLMYKVLMAGTGGPLPSSQTPLPASVYAVPWSPLSAQERLTLASFIPGSEMPLPGMVTASPNPLGLPVDSLERLSLWIAQGAPVSNCP